MFKHVNLVCFFEYLNKVQIRNIIIKILNKKIFGDKKKCLGHGRLVPIPAITGQEAVSHPGQVT